MNTILRLIQEKWDIAVNPWQRKTLLLSKKAKILSVYQLISHTRTRKLLRTSDSMQFVLRQELLIGEYKM
jgi:hypothetical protein